MHGIAGKKHGDPAPESQDRILLAIAQSAAQLVAATSAAAAMAGALETIGKAVRADRVLVLQNNLRGNTVSPVELVAVWQSAAVPMKVDADFFLNPVATSPEIGEWLVPLARGEAVFATAADAPGAIVRLLEFIQSRSILFVPILVENKWWGIVAIDDCKHDRTWSAAETAALKIFAEIAGASITRERHLNDLIQVERGLSEANEKIASIAETAQDAIVMMDAAGSISFWNPAAEKIFGHAAKDAIGSDLHGLLMPERYRAAFEKGLRHFRDTGEGPVIGKTLELQALRKGGAEFAVELSLSAVWLEGMWNAIGIMRDITERKERERELRLFRELVDNSNDAIEVIDPDTFRLLDVNQKECRDLGYSREELLSLGVADISSNCGHAELAMINEHIKRSGFALFEDSHRRKDGSTFPVEVSLRFVEAGKKTALVSIVRDITERKRTEEALRQSLAQLREAQRITRLGYWEWDIVHDVITWSDELERIFELDRDTSGFSYAAFLDHIHPDDRDLFSRANAESAKSGAPYEVLFRLLMKDGRVKYVHSRYETFCDADGKPVRKLGTAQDITELKEAGLALQRLNQTLRTITAVSETLVHAKSERQLLDDMCRIAVEVGGYRLAWIGFVEHDNARTVRPVAWAGEHPEYLKTVNITWSDTERGRGPCGVAIRTGETQVKQNTEIDPVSTPWREQRLKYGFKSTVSLPLKDGPDVFGCLTLYAGEVDAFAVEQVELLQQAAADLSYGICAQRNRVGLEAAISTLQENLKATVSALAAAVEIRDIYTAGHQRRVADLATAIAREIGLSEHEIKGLFLAALIHDIGKINVPSEILSKPGKLTPLEFQLIQTHVQAGYDIIKNIDFPWPIGQAILQHHERLDGSGYPNHLKGDAIQIEGRILAVSDVVDAMTSHRPYRPALGIDAALDEIGKGKGRLYDPAVVDACIALFRQKGFVFH